MVNLNNVLNSSASVQVHAHWAPMEDGTFKLYEESPQHAELFALSPAHRLKEYKTAAFSAFLPPTPIEVGEVWELEMRQVLPFLRQFHPSAKSELCHSRGAKGAYGCLRAISPVYAEVVFRIHAEFTFTSTAYEEWQQQKPKERKDALVRFMPSQFAGRVLINREKEAVHAFSLSLPPHNTNVDIHAYGFVDMVFVPCMELIATDLGPLGGITWEHAISEEAARKALELKFYKSAEIEWHPVEEAIALAKATHRPIHAVVLWGALDGESC